MIMSKHCYPNLSALNIPLPTNPWIPWLGSRHNKNACRLCHNINNHHHHQRHRTFIVKVKNKTSKWRLWELCILVTIHKRSGPCWNDMIGPLQVAFMVGNDTIVDKLVEVPNVSPPNGRITDRRLGGFCPCWNCVVTIAPTTSRIKPFWPCTFDPATFNRHSICYNKLPIIPWPLDHPPPCLPFCHGVRNTNKVMAPPTMDKNCMRMPCPKPLNDFKSIPPRQTAIPRPWKRWYFVVSNACAWACKIGALWPPCDDGNMVAMKADTCFGCNRVEPPPNSLAVLRNACFVYGII
mmetsp:Transcript_20147/g.42174  ORF Transcript_20147/g.42174 Transcript_20147/m.42174 type:complete len:293 (-) Transcript_20147:422-1300(-)